MFTTRRRIVGGGGNGTRRWWTQHYHLRQLQQQPQQPQPGVQLQQRQRHLLFSTTADNNNSNNSNSFLRDQFSLEGRTALVTGGGTGIGAAVASGLYKAGANVVLAGRREGPLEQTRDAILEEAGGGEEQQEEGRRPVVIAYPCDATDFSQLPHMMKELEYLAGNVPPTILINNAGTNVRQPADSLTTDHFYETFALMLTAPFMLARAMSPNFRTERYGRIVNMASLQSFAAFPNSIPYAAAKSGTLGLTRALAEAYSPVHGYDDVTCNAVAPGFVETELTASVFQDQERADALASNTLLGRNSVPEDLVGTVVFLTSKSSRYVTGQVLPVDGGFTALGHR